MNEQLELKVEPKQRLVLRPFRDEVLVEVQTPTHAKEGHGWGIITQLRLDHENVVALHQYLTQRMNEAN